MEIDENLLSRVSDFLNTEDGAQILNQLKSSFGADSGSKAASPNIPDFSQLLSGFSGVKKEDANSESGIDVTKLLPLISAITKAKTDDRATNLLTSLKPLLSKERVARVDHAITLMKIIALLPILKEYGFSISDLF